MLRRPQRDSVAGVSKHEGVRGHPSRRVLRTLLRMRIE
jgi:hypothetical protein